MVGINNVTNVTLENLTSIYNITSGDPIEFFINANHTIYGGWFFFIMLWILAFILFRKAQEKHDQPLINAMYIMTTLTIISFFMRAIFIVKNGVVLGLLTDFQMWIFPLLAVTLALINKYLQES